MLFGLVKHFLGRNKTKAGATDGNSTLDAKKLDRHDVAAVALGEMIEYAAEQKTSLIDEMALAKVNAFARAFNGNIGKKSAGLNVFVYHAMVREQKKIRYRDVSMNLGDNDYQAVINEFVNAVIRCEPDARIYVATDNGSELALPDLDNLRRVELDVDTENPMYERVVAMTAYVMSEAFDADTVFLDSDAFVNKPLKDIFDTAFDVGVTVRDVEGLMPVNEGVIFASRRSIEGVRSFFRDYLATYTCLAQDERVKGFYGDIKRWRGGQLTLNALCLPVLPGNTFRVLEVDGTRLWALPCDLFNFSYDNNSSLSGANLDEKYVVHLKGARKRSIDEWVAYASNRRVVRSGKQGLRGITPHFAMWNKEYSVTPFDRAEYRNRFSASLKSASKLLRTNEIGSAALLCDDMLVWFRNLSFLNDERFVSAMGVHREDAILRARIWRVYLLCWAANSCRTLDGDYLDLGCYDGKTVEVMLNFLGFKDWQHKKYYLCDLFENPPEESRKSLHGPDLYRVVSDKFSTFHNVAVVKGALPASLVPDLPEKIAFAQIDLNHAKSELACFELIYDRLVPGAIVIFDDFGFSRYHESNELEANFVRQRGDLIFESPTGQGLFIKR